MRGDVFAGNGRSHAMKNGTVNSQTALLRNCSGRSLQVHRIGRASVFTRNNESRTTAVANAKTAIQLFVEMTVMLGLSDDHL